MRSANFSLFLLGKHMDGDMCRLVVDITDVSDERGVAYAHLRDMRLSSYYRTVCILFTMDISIQI